MYNNLDVDEAYLSEGEDEEDDDNNGGGYDGDDEAREQFVKPPTPSIKHRFL